MTESREDITAEICRKNRETLDFLMANESLLGAPPTKMRVREACPSCGARQFRDTGDDINFTSWLRDTASDHALALDPVSVGLLRKCWDDAKKQAGAEAKSLRRCASRAVEQTGRGIDGLEPGWIAVPGKPIDELRRLLSSLPDG